MSGYLCPVCRSPRKTELRDHISWHAHLQIALITFAASGVLYLWGGLSIAWRGVLFYLPQWAIAEFLHWARMREAAKCEACHFDPILYQKDPMAARRQVEAKLNIFVTDLKMKLQQKSPNAKPENAAEAATPPAEEKKANPTAKAAPAAPAPKN